MHIIFDTEIIGTEKPVFLIGTKIMETGKVQAFWSHKPKDVQAFVKLLDADHTWVGFNSENFDRPLIAAMLDGHPAINIKNFAQFIISEEMRSWKTYKEFNIPFQEYDHIDLIDVAPGVMISLKTYAGRMSYPTMVDMPFHHDKDLTPSEMKTLEKYCLNDLNVTEELFKQLKVQMDLRYQLSEEYEIDLRSKSDAQIAEAILKKKCGIRSSDKVVPRYVRYTTPSFIKTTHKGIREVIELLNEHEFVLNRMNGQPNVPEFLKEPFRINNGLYQMGVGGLHSTHDVNMYLEESETLMLSDFDVASYYPNIMMKAGLIPKLGGNKGALFIDEYRKIYEQRMEAKRAGDKTVANSLKITLNGTFGKLGNIYCSFYSPDLLLAVTLTGQLNLLCLIHELEKIKGVQVRSANTDGVLVAYPPKARVEVLQVFEKNSKRTGFEYEETQYLKYAAKDVNNYFAVKKDKDGRPAGVKRKGLYAVAGIEEMKNPTMEICSDAAAEWLAFGTPLEQTINASSDIKLFVTVRNVKSGGIQHEKTIFVDDWEEQSPGLWVHPHMTTQPVKRKSRPKPREVFVGGKPFGRVARWYMSTKALPPITSMSGEVPGVKNGGKVPKSEGGKLLLTLTDSMPKDIDRDWYVAEAKAILQDCGVAL